MVGSECYSNRHGSGYSFEVALELPGDDADLCGIAELDEEVFAVFPGEPEGAYIGNTDPRHGVANGRKRRDWTDTALRSASSFGSSARTCCETR